MAYTEIVRTSGGRAIIVLDNEIPALGGFDAEYIDDDHHISEICIGSAKGSIAEFNRYFVGLRDSSSGIWGRDRDQARVAAKFVDLYPNLPGSIPESPDMEVPRTEVPTMQVIGSSSNNGEAILPIPRLENDELFVLRGFEIRAESDHNLLSIAVRYNRETSAIHVTFKDNSPDDDTFFTDIDYFVIPDVSRTGRVNPYFEGAFSQQFEFTDSVEIPKDVQGGDALLSGFSFEFLDGDHHIKNIAIDLEPSNIIYASFTDSQRSHSVLANVDYVVMRSFVL